MSARSTKGAAIGLLLIGVVLFFLWSVFKTDQEFDKQCDTFADPVRVRIHNTRFNLPAAYEPIFNSKLNALGMPEVEAPRAVKFKTQDGAKFNKGYCQKTTSPEIRVWGFSLTVGKLDIAKKPAVKVYDDESDVYGFGSEYMINVLPTHGHLRQNYCEVWTANSFSIGERKRLAENSLFYEMNSKTKDYYISDQVTLFGNPVVIACNQDRSCGLMAPINNDAEAEVNFTLDEIKPDAWPDFISEYQRFLSSLMPDNNGSKIYPDCKYLLEDAKRNDDITNHRK